MTKINSLIDKAAGVCSPANDSALAARLHLSRSAVSLWRRGGAISEKHLTALIALADVDAATAVEILEQQAETKPQKAVWGALAKRLAATATLLAVVVLPALSTTMQDATGQVSQATYRHYAKWKDEAKWIVRLLGLWIRSKLPKPKGPHIEAQSW